MASFRLCSFNVYNLVRPGAPYYSARAYSAEEHHEKTSWIGAMLRHIDAEIVGFPGGLPRGQPARGGGQERALHRPRPGWWRRGPRRPRTSGAARRSSPGRGYVLNQQIFNDHIFDETISERRKDRTMSDHGIPVAEIRLDRRDPDGG